MELKHGRWVVIEAGVGILQRERISEPPYVRWDVHLVDEKGDTRFIVPNDPSCRQARLSEIPEPRRPKELTPELASRGYTE